MDERGFRVGDQVRAACDIQSGMDIDVPAGEVGVVIYAWSGSTYSYDVLFPGCTVPGSFWPVRADEIEPCEG